MPLDLGFKFILNTPNHKNSVRKLVEISLIKGCIWVIKA